MRTLFLAITLLAAAAIAAQTTTAVPAATATTVNFTLSATDVTGLTAARAELVAAVQALKKARSDWTTACAALITAKGWPAKTNCRMGDGAIILPSLAAPAVTK